MKRSKIYLACCLLLAAIASMLVLSQDANARYNPHDLQPIVPYDIHGDGYHELVFKTLITPERPQVWMMVVPSFQVEFAIILIKIEDRRYRYHYELEYAVVEERIWNWSNINDSISVLDLREDVAVKRQRVKIPNKTAESLIRTWEKALKKRTRYSDKSSDYIDGTVYQFFCWPNYFAGTWSPEKGIPKMMVDCGELLIQYVTAKDDDRDEILKKIDDLLEKIRYEI